MSGWVAFIGEAVSRHEDWEAALNHVAVVQLLYRAQLWFQDLPGRTAICIYDRPPGAGAEPIARVYDPVQYQRALSRGDLEQPQEFCRAGAENSDPAPTNKNQPTMFTKPPKSQTPTTPPPTSYLVLKRIMYKAVERLPESRLDMSDKEASSSQVRGWVLRKMIRGLTDAEKTTLTVLPDPPTAKRKAVAVPAPAPETEVETADGEFQLLDPATVAPSPVNPRRYFDTEEMDELTASVREKGVRIAINVRAVPPGTWLVEPAPLLGRGKWTISNRHRPLMSAQIPDTIFRSVFDSQAQAQAALPRWEIIAGERRWRAARLAGSATIRAIIEVMDDIEAAELQVIENGQRADLRPLEDAAGYQHLLSLPGYTMEQLVQKTGKAKNTIYGKLKLLELPEPVQAAVEKGTLPVATAEIIARLDGELQQAAVKEILTPQWQREPLSFRGAKEAVTRLKGDDQRRKLHEAAEAKARADGYEVLTGERARGVISYSDQVAHNCGFVAVGDVCPRDPHGATWKQVVERSEKFMGENQLFVAKYAVVANAHRDGYKTVAVYARDHVNVLLKALGLWEAEGSKITKEKADKAAAKEKHGRDREAMMQDLDAIRRQVERERSPRRALLAAVWAATDDYSVSEAVEFVAKRRAWISLDDRAGEANRIVRSLASDLEVRELQALVVELAIAQMGEEESYFADSREEVRGLVDGDYVDDPSADARTEEEEAVAA